MCIDQNPRMQRGISLIELIIFIIVISVGLTGILVVMNQTTAHSADPLIHKQAIAAAESILEEIELQDFSMPSGVTATSGTVSAANRAGGYHIVADYAGGDFSDGVASGIASIDGAMVLPNYNATVIITNADLGVITAASGSAVRITVTVATPQGEQIAIDGYRTAY